MSAATAAILNESAITAIIGAVFAAIVALLDRVRQPETFASTAPRVRGPRAGIRCTEHDAPPDPRTVARDAQIVDAWQRGERPGRHAPGGVR